MDDEAPKETGYESPEPTGDAGPPSDGSSGGGNWRAAALFLMGVVVGVLGLGIFTAWTSGGKMFAKVTPAPALDAAALRAAARLGTIDAISTLQASGPQAQAPQPTAAAVPANAFALREANRIGNKDAPVTIVEFSDFQ